MPITKDGPTIRIIKDGPLEVYDPNGRAIAVYLPGSNEPVYYRGKVYVCRCGMTLKENGLCDNSHTVKKSKTIAPGFLPDDGPPLKL